MRKEKEATKANLLFLSIVCLYILVQIGFIALAYRNVQLQLPYYIGLSLGEFILIIPTALYVLLDRGECLKSIQFGSIRAFDLLKLVVLSYLISPVISFINAISTLFMDNVVTDTLETMVERPLVVIVVLLGVLPAIFEELIFRGIIYHSFRKYHIGRALLFSALLFGCMHMNLNQFLYAVVIGFFFALIVEATGSILASITIHFVINTSNVVAGILSMRMLQYAENMNKKLEEQLGEESGAQSLLEQAQTQDISFSSRVAVIITLGITAVIFGFLAFLLFRNIARSCGRWEHIKGIFGKSGDEQLNVVNRSIDKEQEKITTLPFFIAVGICFIYIILSFLLPI